DPVYDAVRDRIEGTPQRAGVGLWRTVLMTKTMRYGLVAAGAVVVLIIGSTLLGSGSRPPGGEVSPSLAPSIAPSEAPPSGEKLPEGSFAWSVTGPQTEVSNNGPHITVTIPASGWV